MLLLQDYDLSAVDGWSIENFILDYTMIGFIPCFVLWKVVKRTKYVRPGTVDIDLGETEEIDLYESLRNPRVESKAGALFNRLFE